MTVGVSLLCVCTKPKPPDLATRAVGSGDENFWLEGGLAGGTGSGVCRSLSCNSAGAPGNTLERFDGLKLEYGVPPAGTVGGSKAAVGTAGDLVTNGLFRGGGGVSSSSGLVALS